MSTSITMSVAAIQSIVRLRVSCRGAAPGFLIIQFLSRIWFLENLITYIIVVHVCSLPGLKRGRR